MSPLSQLVAFIHLSHVHTVRFSGGIKYCSSLECTIDGWIYILYEKQMQQKQRLSSCSDHLVQYCTKKWIKGQKLLSKEKCRSWALALVTLSSFTKRDRKNLLEPYKHGYLLWNCHSFELKKKSEKWKLVLSISVLCMLLHLRQYVSCKLTRV